MFFFVGYASNLMKIDVQETAKTEESGNLIALTNQVQYLSQQMNELLLDRQLGGADVNLADPQGALQKFVLLFR